MYGKHQMYLNGLTWHRTINGLHLKFYEQLINGEYVRLFSSVWVAEISTLVKFCLIVQSI